MFSLFFRILHKIYLDFEKFAIKLEFERLKDLVFSFLFTPND